MAPSVNAGDTVLETNAVTFGALARSGDGPSFQPQVDEADVVLPGGEAGNRRHGRGDDQMGTRATSPAAAAGSAIGNAASLFALVT